MARGFGTTFGTSGTTDKIVGGTNITVGTTMSTAFWTFRNGNGGAGFGTVFCISDGVLTNYMGLFNNSTLNYAFQRRWTNAPVWTFAKPTLSAWAHICVTYDGGSTSNVPVVYVNGVSVSVTTATAPTGLLATITQVPTIGNDPSNGDAWDGLIAEVGFWNSTILTANEALALATGAFPFNIRNAALTFYSPCLGLQATEPDWGNNRFSLTNTGSKYQNHAPVKELKALMTGT